MVRAAEGYALERVNSARGDAARFVAIYDEYRKAPEVTRKRLYLETLNEVLPKIGRKLIIDSTMKGLLPLLNLDPDQAGGQAVMKHPASASAPSSCWPAHARRRRSTRSARPSRSSSPSSASRSASRSPTRACT